MPRRAAWLLELVMLGALALVSAHTASNLAELAIWRFAPPGVEPHPPPLTHVTLRPEALARVLPEIASRPPRARARNSRLLGTVVSRDPRWSWALLGAERGAEPLMVGDHFGGEEVVSIEPGRVTLRGPDGFEVVELAGQPSELGPGAPPPDAPAPLRISRAELDRLAADPSPLFADARFVPAFQDGQLAGFRPTFVRPGSPFATLGLRGGDLVRSIGGVDARSPAGLLGALPGLLQQRRVEVVVDRGGSPVTLTVEVAP